MKQKIIKEISHLLDKGLVELSLNFCTENGIKYDQNLNPYNITGQRNLFETIAQFYKQEMKLNSTLAHKLTGAVQDATRPLITTTGVKPEYNDNDKKSFWIPRDKVSQTKIYSIPASKALRESLIEQVLNTKGDYLVENYQKHQPLN